MPLSFFHAETMVFMLCDLHGEHCSCKSMFRHVRVDSLEHLLILRSAGDPEAVGPTWAASILALHAHYL